MSVTLTSNITTISDCEQTTGWSGLGTLDTDLFKEGSNSLSGIVTGTGVDDDVTYDLGAGGTNLTNQHVRLWFMTTATTYLANFNDANGAGVMLYFEDTSGNKMYFDIVGKDTYLGGWLNMVVYTGKPTLNTNNVGNCDFSIIRYIGLAFNKATRPKNVVNTWVDYLRYGDGITADGTNGTFDEIATADETSGYGIVEKINGVYFLSGSLELTGTFSDTGKVVVFSNKDVSDELYTISSVPTFSISDVTSTGAIQGLSRFSNAIDKDKIAYFNSTISPFELYAIDMTTFTWITNLTDVGSSTRGMIHHEGKLYTTTTTGKMYIYDIENDTWDKTTGDTTTMNITATSSCVKIRGVIYYGNSIDEFWKYDIASNTWTEITNTFETNDGLELMNRFIIFDDDTTGQLYVYDVEGTESGLSSESLVAIRNKFTYGGVCYVVEDDTTDKLYRFDPFTKKFHYIKDTTFFASTHLGNFVEYNGAFYYVKAQSPYHLQKFTCENTAQRFSLTNCVITSDNKPYSLNFLSVTTGTNEIKGNSISNASNGISLGANQEWSENTFSDNGTIFINHSKFTSNKVTNFDSANFNSALSLRVANIFNNNDFVGNTKALQYEVDGTYTLSNTTFSTNTLDISNKTGGALVINSTGTTNPSTSDGNTTINNSATLTLTGLISGSEVRILQTGTTTEIDGVESSTTSFDYTYNYPTGYNVDIVIHNVDYEYIKLKNISLGSTSASLPIQQQKDLWYTP